MTEENCLEYLSGYFFKRLLSFHSTNCQICSNFAQKFTNHAEVSMVSQFFLHFKRYDTDKATLYQCTDNFIHFVRSVIQVASFMYIHFPAQDNIVSVVVNSFLQNGVNSTKLVLCSDNIIHRFAEVIARTILFYRMKWTNDNMKKEKSQQSKRK